MRNNITPTRYNKEPSKVMKQDGSYYPDQSQDITLTRRTMI